MVTTISRLCGLVLILLAPAAFAQDGELDVRVISEADELPARCAVFVKDALAALPEGHQLRVTLGQFFDFGHSSSTNQLEPYVASVVPVTAAGLADGEEQVFVMNRREVERRVPYVNGIKQGIEKHYQQGKLVVELPWQDDQIHGTRKAYHSNGKLRNETTYDQGAATGPTRSYGENGQLTRTCEMRDGRRDGQLTDFWATTGKPRREITYVNGKVEGTMREFFEDGKPRREADFVNDQLHGVEIRYDADGSVAETRYWLAGDRVSKEEYVKRTQR